MAGRLPTKREALQHAVKSATNQKRYVDKMLSRESQPKKREIAVKNQTTEQKLRRAFAQEPQRSKMQSMERSDYARRNAAQHKRADRR